MERTGGIGILVKTPGHSPIKTRLAQSVGKRGAETFHRLACQAVAHTLEKLAERFPITPYWSVAEASATTHPDWKQFAVLPQGEGSFGMRLGTGYTQLLSRHHFAILLAPDSPQIPEKFLELAIGHLQSRRGFVVGPARDGGFYLVGGNIPLSPVQWNRVAYSGTQTEHQVTEWLAKEGAVIRLPPLTDVDHGRDLVQLEKEWSRPYPPLGRWLAQAPQVEV